MRAASHTLNISLQFPVGHLNMLPVCRHYFVRPPPPLSLSLSLFFLSLSLSRSPSISPRRTEADDRAPWAIRSWLPCARAELPLCPPQSHEDEQEQGQRGGQRGGAERGSSVFLSRERVEDQRFHAVESSGKWRREGHEHAA